MGIFFWRKSNKSSKYSLDEVKFIFEQILIRTIDRENLKELMYKQLSPIVGDEFIINMYQRLNTDDKISDQKQIGEWMRRIEYIKKQKIFR